MPAISKLLNLTTTSKFFKSYLWRRRIQSSSEEEIGFNCDCSRERFENALITLGKDELTAMKDEDHGAEITCQFCGKLTTSLKKIWRLIND